MTDEIDTGFSGIPYTKAQVEEALGPMPPNNDELMPCPFCGGKPMLKGFPDRGDMAAVVCGTSVCDRSGLLIAVADRNSDNFETAIRAWNTRATPPPSGDAVRAAVDLDLDQLLYRCDKLGSWMSAALDDPNVCQEMKDDITSWFRALEYYHDRLRALPADQGEFMYASSAELFKELGQSDKQAESSERGVEAIIRRGNMAAVTADQPDEDAAKALPEWANFERVDHLNGAITYESHGYESIAGPEDTFIVIQGARAKDVAETIRAALSAYEGTE